MTIAFYYGSGSPYAWKVHLALEHKELPYERTVMSFDAGDTRKPAFLNINPRGRVPTIDDNGYVIYESNAILEYLDDAYPERGGPLFPGDARERGLVRRLVAEVDNYVYPAVDRILDQAFGKGSEEQDGAAIEAGRDAVIDELRLYTRSVRGPYLAGPLSAADFALYPYVAFLFRVELKRIPNLRAAQLLTPELAAWRARIEALPYFARTYPPHWGQP
jgi:glutathione S-transferase